MTTNLVRIAEKAKADRKLRFTSLAHLLTPEFLLETWKQMNHKGASGVDGETTKEFESDLETRVEQLCARLKARQYRPPPVRRVEIPKGNGKTRPLGIPIPAANYPYVQVPALGNGGHRAADPSVCGPSARGRGLETAERPAVCPCETS
jgi:hypothetical protein